MHCQIQSPPSNVLVPNFWTWRQHWGPKQPQQPLWTNEVLSKDHVVSNVMNSNDHGQQDIMSPRLQAITHPHTSYPAPLDLGLQHALACPHPQVKVIITEFPMKSGGGDFFFNCADYYVWLQGSWRIRDGTSSKEQSKSNSWPKRNRYMQIP